MAGHKNQKRMLVSYSYHVNTQLFNGEVPQKFSAADQYVANHPKGKEVTVYFAPKDPGFSRINSPPTHFDIIGSTAMLYAVLPFFALNAVSGYLFWIFNVT
eukprot:UN30224